MQIIAVVLLSLILLVALATLAEVVRISRRQATVYLRRPDPAVAAPDVVLTGLYAPDGSYGAPQAGRVHYLVQRRDGLITVPEYDGYDSNAAMAAWLRLERDPSRYPGEHEFLENGRRRGHKPLFEQTERVG